MWYNSCTESTLFFIDPLFNQALTRRCCICKTSMCISKPFCEYNEFSPIYYSIVVSFPSLHLIDRDWYRRNFTITLLMGRVAFHSVWRTLAERRGWKKGGPATWYSIKYVIFYSLTLVFVFYLIWCNSWVRNSHNTPPTCHDNTFTNPVICSRIGNEKRTEEG